MDEIDRKLQEARKEEGRRTYLSMRFKDFAQEIERGRMENNQALLKTLELARDLEGSIRQTGVHACGVLIGRILVENIPLMQAKEANLLVTQYEGTLVESISLLKMVLDLRLVNY